MAKLITLHCLNATDTYACTHSQFNFLDFMTVSMFWFENKLENLINNNIVLETKLTH